MSENQEEGEDREYNFQADHKIEKQKKSVRANKGKDDKDRLIIKLRTINLKLRQNLKELNSKLEMAIDKTAVNTRYSYFTFINIL